VCCLEMTSKRKLIGRLVPCRCFRGEEEIVSVLDYSHCGLQQVPKEVFNFERTLEELYLDANQIEELPKVTAPWHQKFLWCPVPGSGVTTALGSSLSLLFLGISPLILVG
ncbi:LRRC7 protein, partial [Leucopsar rothschildi]|nr:LRRC7 protein [Leucopsar rothschildi]